MTINPKDYSVRMLLFSRYNASRVYHHWVLIGNKLNVIEYHFGKCSILHV